jgi:hypothetical protein
VNRVLIGGAFCLVFGLVFVIGGIVNGDGGHIALGIPGVLLGGGALLSYRLNKPDQP